MTNFPFLNRLEMVRLGLLKKKEFEAKSLTIVERLIDPEVNKEWLRDSVIGCHITSKLAEKNLFNNFYVFSPGFLSESGKV